MTLEETKNHYSRDSKLPCLNLLESIDARILAGDRIDLQSAGKVTTRLGKES